MYMLYVSYMIGYSCYTIQLLNSYHLSIYQNTIMEPGELDLSL